jgi:hypothetical protein
MIATIVLREPPALTPSADGSWWTLVAVLAWLLLPLIVARLMACRHRMPGFGRVDPSRRFPTLLAGVYVQVERALRDPVLVNQARRRLRERHLS